MYTGKHNYSVDKCIHLRKLTNMLPFAQNKQANNCLSGKTTLPLQEKNRVKAKFMVHFPFFLNMEEVKDTFSELNDSLPVSSMILFR